MSLEGVAPSPVTSNGHKVSPVGRLEGEFLGHPGVDSASTAGTNGSIIGQGTEVPKGHSVQPKKIKSK